MGSTFLKNGSKHFAFKNSLFGPLQPSNDDSLAYFYWHLSLFVPIGFSFFGFGRPSKYCFSLQSRALFASRAASAKMLVCNTPEILFFFASSAFFLYFYALTLLLFALVDHFFEKVLPALGGKHDFENCM